MRTRLTDCKPYEPLNAPLGSEATMHLHIVGRDDEEYIAVFAGNYCGGPPLEEVLIGPDKHRRYVRYVG